EDTRAGAIDDGVAERLKVTPAGTARVHHGGDAGTEAERVRLHAVVAGPGVANPRGMEQGCMNVYHAGCDVKAGNIDCFAGARRIGGRRNVRDPAPLNADIVVAVDVVFGIDDTPAFEQQVVLTEHWRQQKEREDQPMHTCPSAFRTSYTSVSSARRCYH